MQWITIDFGGGVQKEAIVVVAPDGSVTVAAEQADPTPDGGTYLTYDAWPSLVGLRGAFGAATPGSGHFNSYFQFTECAPAPVAYCRPKRNSLGCVPSITTSGTSSATHANGFTVSASPLMNQKLGLWIYSSRAATRRRSRAGSGSPSPSTARRPRRRAEVRRRTTARARTRST